MLLRPSCLPAVFALLFLFSACGEDIIPPPDRHKVEPTGNDLITSQKVGPETGTPSDLWEMMPTADGRFACRGSSAGRAILGLLDASGNLAWEYRLGYNALGLWTGDGPGALSGPIVVGVGGRDVTGGSESDAGAMTVVGPQGAVIDQVVWQEEGRIFHFRDVILLSSGSDRLTFLAVGTEKLGEGLYQPLLATLSLDADGRLQSGELHPVTALPNRSCWAVAADPAGSGFFVAGNNLDASGNARSTAVSRLNGDFSLDWTASVEGRSGRRTVYLGSLAVTPDRLYVCGYYDSDREVSDGEYWDSGYIASLTHAGQVSWVKTPASSEFSDGLYTCQVVGSDLLAVGYHASVFIDSGNKPSFGYGWLVRMDPLTGQVRRSATLGDAGYESLLKCLCPTGSRLLAGGWTGRETSDTPVRSWFVEIDAGRLGNGGP